MFVRQGKWDQHAFLNVAIGFSDSDVNETNRMEFQGCGLELWPIWLTEHFDAGGDYVAWCVFQG